MTPHEFVEKWRRANLSERSACQQHFLDLCELLGQPKPAAADPDGAWYTFERGVTKTEGGQGWADVWMRGHFGWEYKGKHKDLAAAYRQLLLYREDLENPPLLVVCDLDRFEVHTNFTGTAKKIYAFDFNGLAQPANLDVLRNLFTDPDALRPGQTAIGITEETANLFGRIADGMRVRGVPAHDAAHFLMKLMFCMFAEDIDLLSDEIFTKTLEGSKINPAKLSTRLGNLFAAMADGGDFGATTIPYFNGGLFADQQVFDLSIVEIEELLAVNAKDWSSVEPSIFGTLFERTLDPAKRSQIGAHYTSRADIETLLEPVVMMPLRREWDEVRAKCDKLWEKFRQERGAVALSKKRTKQSLETTAKKKLTSPRGQHDRLLQDFVEHLAHLKILDPACGSGNFLYVAINLLLDLEKEVIAYAATHGTSVLPQVRPTQLYGIEINPYAQQLAQVVIWIGYLQWKHDNGFPAPRDPILEPIETIKLMDAILDISEPEHPKQPRWPRTDFIVGNPPFLGDKKLRSELGSEYVDSLFSLYADRIPNQSDLCCYWFERAREQVVLDSSLRVGLLATQGIRAGANRETLKRIKQSGQIFFAISDRNWILDGANVHVSMVGFSATPNSEPTLDGKHVADIHSNLTSSADLTISRKLAENEGRSFQGPVKVGPFEITDEFARALLHKPNPNGRPTSDVVRPWKNGKSITSRIPEMWIVDFHERPLEEASGYQYAFEHVKKHVKPVRDRTDRERRRKLWWIHGEVNNALRAASRPLTRYAALCQTAKHLMFVWFDTVILPGQTVIAFMDSKSEVLGLLSSRVHWTWARAQGSQLREKESGFRYTPTTCFDTFPFPEPAPTARQAIGNATKELVSLRDNWLNPPEWTRQEILEFPGSVDGIWARHIANPDARGIGTVRYPRIVPKDEDAAKKLAKRTLTNLYNERPTWLDLAHKKLDEAVFNAYGWPADLSDDELLARLLGLNLQRAKDPN